MCAVEFIFTAICAYYCLLIFAEFVEMAFADVDVDYLNHSLRSFQFRISSKPAAEDHATQYVTLRISPCAQGRRGGARTQQFLTLHHAEISAIESYFSKLLLGKPVEQDDELYTGRDGQRYLIASKEGNKIVFQQQRKTGRNYLVVPMDMKSEFAKMIAKKAARVDEILFSADKQWEMDTKDGGWPDLPTPCAD